MYTVSPYSYSYSKTEGNEQVTCTSDIDHNGVRTPTIFRDIYVQHNGLLADAQG